MNIRDACNKIRNGVSPSIIAEIIVPSKVATIEKELMGLGIDELSVRLLVDGSYVPLSEIQINTTNYFKKKMLQEMISIGLLTKKSNTKVLYKHNQSALTKFKQRWR